MHYQRGNNNKWLFLFFLFFSLALVCAWRGGRRGRGRGRDRRSPPRRCWRRVESLWATSDSARNSPRKNFF